MARKSMGADLIVKVRKGVQALTRQLEKMDKPRRAATSRKAAAAKTSRKAAPAKKRTKRTKSRRTTAAK